MEGEKGRSKNRRKEGKRKEEEIKINCGRWIIGGLGGEGESECEWI